MATYARIDTMAKLEELTIGTSVRGILPDLSPSHGPSRMRGVWLTAAALVVLRSFVWVFWEQSHFDSDQAVIGLMAKHVAEFRAFPLVFYGQQYMLAVESWLAAPLFLVFGASVWALKLPLVAINLAVAALLLLVLVRDVGLSRLHALVASLFFLIPPPITASRLVEAQGGNIEPFLYIVLLWLTRGNPMLFGLIAGIGCMHREFTGYAVIAIVLLEAWHGTLFTRANLRAKAIVAVEIVAAVLVVRVLMGHADLLGPGTAGTVPLDVLNGQVRLWISRFGWNPAELGPNLRWLFERNLATLFGWRVEPLGDYLRSRLTGGHPWALVALGALLISAAIAAVAHRSPPGAAAGEDRTTGVPGRAFPAYLVLVGLLTVGVYSLASRAVQDGMLVRYTLLALLIPIGVTAALLRTSGAAIAKGIAIAAVLAWAAAAGLDDGRVLAEYVHRAPRNEYGEFADFLEREGIWYGKAPYWTAYQIDFLTRERVTLGSLERIRISSYEDIVDQHANESIVVFFDDPCTDVGAVAFERWCLLYVPRARHPRSAR